MMSLWDALRMNMMISYQELVRTFLSASHVSAGRTIGRLEAACVGEANDNPTRVQRMIGNIVLSKRVIRDSL